MHKTKNIAHRSLKEELMTTKQELEALVDLLTSTDRCLSLDGRCRPASSSSFRLEERTVDDKHYHLIAGRAAKGTAAGVGS